MKPQVVVVLSAPRSGSSALASMLMELGLDGGPRWQLKPPAEHNKYGYFENVELLDLNEQILAETYANPAENILLNLGFRKSQAREALNHWHWCGRHTPVEESTSVDPNTWKRMRNTTAKIASSNGVPIWKDARFCMTLPLWSRLIQPICIVLWRPPQEVASSLETMTGIPYSAGLTLWYWYTRSALHVSRSFPNLIVSHNLLIHSSVAAANTLADFLNANNVCVSTELTTRAAATIDAAQHRQHSIPSSDGLDERNPHQKLLTWLQRQTGPVPTENCSTPTELLPLIGGLRYLQRRRKQKIIEMLRKVPGYYVARSAYRRIRYK